MVNNDRDFSKLRGLIREKVGTEKELAKKIGRTPGYISNVFRGKTIFSYEDIKNICAVCDISSTDIGCYFFAENVADKAHTTVM